jgi:actin-related protein 3
MIQSCPIDYRRSLYSNIFLSGGSTMFPNFHKRLKQGIQARVDARLQGYEKESGIKSQEIKVSVKKSLVQRYAVYVGGSYLGSQEGFEKVVHKRSEFKEYGASICRYNPVFQQN